MGKIKVILPASEIPEGAIVTKKTGTVEYTLLKKLFMLNLNNIRTNIVAAEGTRFLIPCYTTGNITSIPDHTEMVWEVNEDELLQFLHTR